ncbi:hemolysin type calcium-binding protein [Stella humosa]|uniref:Hemolysin type calcium-binding protein n=1 Tax=Stella humosa TaxID=94 RepID=A0A3N1KPC3_9PROT|nr:calcium-binding protein [Stella humosa]ROP81132.1 hemolysin type calcium-binding protein [Stella humosa]BBK32477.1 hypothetical protein STHU_31110 [Stella humosa]
MVGTITPTVDPIGAIYRSETIALPGGGLATMAADGEDIEIQAYDAAGRASGAPIVLASALPENSGDIFGDGGTSAFGVSADGSRFVVVWNRFDASTQSWDFTAQVVGADGRLIGGAVTLDTPDRGPLPFNEAVDVAPTADGGFLLLGIQRQSNQAEILVFTARLSPEGAQIGDGAEVGRYFTARGELASGNDQAFLLVQRGANGGIDLWRLGEDGEPLGDRVELAYPLPDGTYRTTLGQAEVLANGDLLVSWNNYSLTGEFGRDVPVSTGFQRFDTAGNRIGDAVFTGRSAGVAALQDGGFVVFEDTYYVFPTSPGTEPTIYPGVQLFRVFDADSHPIGEPALPGIRGSLVAMADGKVVVVGDDDGAIFDYPASHDAQWGGSQAYIATWQDQELLSRQDGIGMLRSDAGVAMKPWIANFEAASDADGINATANAMANHLLGGNGANVFIAAGGNDKLYGLGGNDWLLGQDGNDLLDGGDGHDVLLGGLGNDSVAAGAGADTVTGDDRDDAIGGGAGHDLVQGGTGQDFVHGDGGNDTLAGGAGRDWVNGGAGDDIVSGDRDADTLEGGSGADQFRFGAGSGQDVILDFEYGAAGDRIVIDVAGNGTLNGLAIPGSAGLLNAAEDTDDGVLIALGEGHSILLAGLAKADLGADMFLLV